MTSDAIDFQMGADPEFALVNHNKIISGHRYCYNSQDSFGTDGCSILLEVRPDPSFDPLTLITNIRQIFINKCFRTPSVLQYEWQAGSYIKGYSLGGHIHFGIKDYNLDYVIPVLSEYVGACTLLLEDKEEGLLRRSRDECNEYYGGYNDCRRKPYGFEYRTPSSWLTSPYVAAGVLCLAKTVMFECLNTNLKNPQRFDHNTFSFMDVTSIRKFYDTIWTEITKMTLYPVYRDYINLLNFLITHKLTWSPICSMKDAWAITQPVKPTQKLTMQQIWQPAL